VCHECRSSLTGPNRDQLHRGKHNGYSITLSASERTDSGMVNPSAFAVLRLITNSYLVGCWIGSCLSINYFGARATLELRLVPQSQPERPAFARLC
jgi:hypothetical protein